MAGMGQPSAVDTGAVHAGSLGVSMPFVKLDCGILNSTLWVDKDAREIFITALLMAEPHEFAEAQPQIKINSLDYTGWEAPPGWYGFVPAASVAIARQAGMDRDAALAALERLGEPEYDSRTPEHDGRRMIRVDGGFLILNYMKYRDYDHGAADRMRRLRQRRKQNGVTANGDAVTENGDENVTRDPVTLHIAESREQRAEGKEKRPRKRGTRLSEDWSAGKELLDWARNERPDLDVSKEEEKFRDYYLAKSGENATKIDWQRTFKNWIRNAHGQPGRNKRSTGPDDGPYI